MRPASRRNPAAAAKGSIFKIYAPKAGTLCSRFFDARERASTLLLTRVNALSPCFLTRVNALSPCFLTRVNALSVGVCRRRNLDRCAGTPRHRLDFRQRFDFGRHLDSGRDLDGRLHFEARKEVAHKGPGP